MISGVTDAQTNKTRRECGGRLAEQQSGLLATKQPNGPLNNGIVSYKNNGNRKQCERESEFISKICMNNHYSRDSSQVRYLRIQS